MSDYLDGFAPLRRSERAPPREAFERTEVVPFVPFRCPRCGAGKPRTYGQAGSMRYHKCQKCGTAYRSLEVDADRVDGF